MSRIEKLLKRFFQKPKDLTWEELVSILNHFGYKEIASGKTGGSRRKFSNIANVIISLHKPHPKPIVKSYVIEQIITHLKDKGDLK